MKKIANYINGKLSAPASNQYIDNYNPATGSVYSLIPNSGDEDVQFAIKSAREAFDSWSSLPNAKRASWLDKIANAIESRMDELAWRHRPGYLSRFAHGRVFDVWKFSTETPSGDRAGDLGGGLAVPPPLSGCV